ncbi:hypothetical protein D3C71_324340 [compost metagenome]
MGFASEGINNIDYMENVAHEKAVITPPDFDQSFKARDSHMKKASDKERASHGIGLASEHRLPEAFKARTDDDAGTVEIRKEGARPLNIAINSFGSVSNLLAIFSPDGETSLEPGHTIKIVDEFNNRSATITANTFVDIAAALNTFVVERGKYLPSTPDAEASAPAPQEVVPSAKAEAIPTEAVEVAAAPAKTRKAAAAKSVKAKAPETAAAATPAPAKRAAAAKKATARQAKPELAAEDTPAAVEKPAVTKQPSKARPAKAAAPAAPAGWTNSLPVEHVDADGGFRLDARTLALTKEKAKTTSGVSDGSAEHEAFGYEVSEGTAPGGRHLGYIIVEDPKSWIVTGFGDIPFSKHANLNAAAIRIRVTNLPRMR